MVKSMDCGIIETEFELQNKKGGKNVSVILSNVSLNRQVSIKFQESCRFFSTPASQTSEAMWSSMVNVNYGRWILDEPTA